MKLAAAALLATGVLIFAFWQLATRSRSQYQRPPECLATYLELFRAGEVHIRVVFGYKDARPARFVGDRYERAYFVQLLQKLGFRRSTDDDDLFHLPVTGLDGRNKTVYVRVVHSSVGPDDDLNRRNPLQKWQSDYARRAFFDGLKQADVVFYNGHSRTGGGPDFSPPVCARNSHVDYDWYKRNKPGLNAMLESLKQSKSRPKLIGMFSCTSDAHFSKAILASAPQAGLIVSDALTYYVDALEASLDAIRRLVEMRCLPEFSPSGTRVKRFFASPSKTQAG